MPELPDIENYISALESRILSRALLEIRIANPFLLRTVEPSPDGVVGVQVAALERVGKRIAIGFANGHWLVFHLMIAGRLHWLAREPRASRQLLCWLRFDCGLLSLTEAGTQRRASLHVVGDRAGLRTLDPGGLELATASFDAFAAAVTRSNHTLKRALTDPRILSGIGNAYSDEILHKARLSPVRQTKTLERNELETLFDCTHQVLRDWQQRLAPPDGGFPEKVTAFRDGMAVHGRFGRPCPDCGTAIQRIRYASRETNYCPRCQTGGRLLADRSLSRLLKRDWPRSIDELEQTQARHDSSR